MNDLSYTPKGNPQQFPQLSIFEAPQLHLFTPVVERSKPIHKPAETQPEELLTYEALAASVAQVMQAKPVSDEEQAKAKINALRGRYTFVSPYHKTRKLLPFNIVGWFHQNGEHLVEVKTVEYKGWDRKEVTALYKLSSIQHKIESGFLTNNENRGKS